MNLDKIRKDLDKLDSSIVLLLSQRLSFVSKIADYKLKKGIERVQPGREREVIEKGIELGKKHGLRKEYVEDIFRRIIEESHHIEKKIMGR